MPLPQNSILRKIFKTRAKSIHILCQTITEIVSRTLTHTLPHWNSLIQAIIVYIIFSTILILLLAWPSKPCLERPTTFLMQSPKVYIPPRKSRTMLVTAMPCSLYKFLPLFVPYCYEETARQRKHLVRNLYSLRGSIHYHHDSRQGGTVAVSESCTSWFTGREREGRGRGRRKGKEEGRERERGRKSERRKEREYVCRDRPWCGLLTPQSPSPVMYFLQQGHTSSKTTPNSSNLPNRSTP